MTRTAVTDQKRRIVLPNANPGEVYSIRQVAPGQFELSVMIPAPKKRRRRSEVDKLLKTAALTPRMDWKALQRLTREP